MKKNRSTKRALLMSALSMVLCLSMLVGSTFAWFTDSVTSSGNIIKSGTLDVELLDASGASLEGKVIEWDAADDRDQEAILWEPGCTYKTEPFTVKNAGNLALKYEIVINGIDGNAKLLEAIEWTVTVGDDTIALANLKGELPAGESTAAIVLSGHMKEEAGNEYQGLTAEGISIAVLATQLTAEKDSLGKDYDANATLPEVTVVSTAAELKAALAEGGDIVLTADIAVDADETIKIASGKDVTLDLNGHTISTVSDATGSNRNAFDVNGGKLTVKNGTVTIEHTGANMGWNSSTNVFNVTAGGVLNIEDAVIENLGGSDMAFCVHLNNWGEVTLNAKNTTFKSNYVAIRVFNSGNDMNNVTLENCHVEGASNALWVHNYTEADFGTSEKVENQKGLLNFTLSGNTYVGNSANAGPIRLGFTNAIYGDETILP